ncbi:MAG: SDR family oxidoreductase [Saprospiraceae bacterium]|nr:SDR family oxidoreductase [Saprospiraceae bacterium]
MTYIDSTGLKVLVTGGAGVGVGSGICEALYQGGAQLIINDINDDILKKVAQKYPDSLTIRADLENIGEVEKMFEQIDDFCGGINGLVNNAGIGLSKVAHKVTEEEFAHLYGVNFQAVWRLSKMFVNACLQRNDTGNIVNITSVHAHSTQSRYAIYASAKNAIVGLTRGMACEIGPLGFRVNAVGPGYVHAEQNYDLIKTWTDDPEKWVKDFIRTQQVLTSEIKPVDIGNTVSFLLSDLARSITGQTIYVDAGTTSLLMNRDLS